MSTIIIISVLIGIYPSILTVLFIHIVEDVLIDKGAKQILLSLIASVFIIYGIAAICEIIIFLLYRDLLLNLLVESAPLFIKIY